MSLLMNPKIILVIVILSMISAASWYFLWSQDKITSQAEEIVLLKADQVSNKAIIERLELNLKEVQLKTDALAREFAKAEETPAYVIKLLGKHDLNKLVTGKPKMMEKRINKGTKELAEAFEKITKPESFEKENEEVKK